MKNLIDLLIKLDATIQSSIGYPATIALVIVVILVIYLAWYEIVRKQYSDEAWKIRKKNGKKSIFWYDEYGNKVYRRPNKSNPPNKKRAVH